MFKLFKTNRLFQSLLFIPYLLLLRWYGFSHDIPSHFESGNILYSLLLGQGETSALVTISIATVLVFIQAILLILITNKHKLFGDENLLSGLFYIIITSISIYFMGLSPALLANTFLILALMDLFQIYKIKEPATHHFQAGFWIALASLFYGVFSVFFLFGFIAIIIMRTAEIRIFLQYLSGFLVPYFLMFTYFFAQKKLAFFSQKILEPFGLFELTPLATKDFYTLGIFLVLLLLVFFNYGTFIQRKGMKNQKIISLLYIFLLISIGSIFIQSPIQIEYLLSLAIPLSILIALLFSRITSIFWTEIWHILLILAILMGHYWV